MRHYYLIVDTETTKSRTVADFGAVLVDRTGSIVEQFGCMVNGHFGKLPLFSNPESNPNDFWSEQSAQRRMKQYDEMLEDGRRSISSVALVNQWLSGINARYSPTLTAYNLPFDLGSCGRTGINLGMFNFRFCLMRAAKKTICSSADYVEFCENWNLKTPTGRVRMTADSVAKFVCFNGERYGLLDDEPHTALEDSRDYEAKILWYILENHTRQQIWRLGQ